MSSMCFWNVPRRDASVAAMLSEDKLGDRIGRKKAEGVLKGNCPQ